MKIKLSGVFGRTRQINNSGIGIHAGQGAADRTLRKMFRQPAGRAAVLTRSPGGSIGVALSGRAGRIESDPIRTMLRGARPVSPGDPRIPLAPGPGPVLGQAPTAGNGPDPHPPADNPALHAGPDGLSDRQAGTGCPAEQVEALLASALGGPRQEPGVQSEPAPVPELKQACEAIVALAEALQPGEIGNRTTRDALLAALVERLSAGEARIHAMSGEPGRARAALALVAHQARAIEDATRWPATGAGLIGMGPPDPVIDPLLEQARRQALASLMVRAERSRSSETRPGQIDQAGDTDQPVPGAGMDLPVDAMARIESDVEEIIRLERAAAHAFSSLERAFGLAGFAPSFRLNAFRLDETTIAAIRSNPTLIGSPEKVSLILGVCLGIERQIASSAAVRRLAGDLSAVRQTIAEERDRPDLTAARGELSSLKLERFKLEQLFVQQLESVVDQGEDPERNGNLIDLRAGLADVHKRIAALEARPDFQHDRESARAIRAIDRELATLEGPEWGESDSILAVDGRSDSDSMLASNGQAVLPNASGADRTTAAGRAGFTPAELSALGLDPDTALPRIIEVCEQYARMGLSAPEQVASLIETAGRVGDQIGHKLAATSPTGADNERLAQSLGRQLLAVATGIERADPANTLGFRDAFNSVLPAATPPDDDPLAITAQGFAALTQEALALRLVSEATPNPDADRSIKLDAEGSLYLERSERAADLGESLQELAARREAARAVIAERNRTVPGSRALDLDRPRGLAISRALLEARSILEQADHSGRVPDARRLSTLARTLRGFDPLTFSQPRFGGRSPDESILRSWVSDEGTLDLARAVILLREDAQLELAALERAFKRTAVAMDEAIRARAALMGDAASKRLSAGLRAAILADLGTRGGDGARLSNYRPAEHFGAISARLREWGIDTDRFAPEIRHQLSQSFGPTEVALWADEAGIDGRLLNSPAGEPDPKVEETETDPPERDSVAGQAVRLVEALQVGSNMKLFGGTRWQVSGGVRIGVAGGALRTQQSEVANLEIERGIDGYRLTLRAGHEGLYGIDASVTVTPANTLVSLGAKLGAEASRSLVEGFRLRFEDSPDGRVALTRLVSKLMDDPASISHLDLIGALDISESSRRKAVKRVAAQASAGLKTPNLRLGATSLGAQVGVRAQIGAGITDELIRDASLRERGFESSREYSIQASAGLQATVRGRAGGTQQTAEDSRAEAVELAAEIRYKRILKSAFNTQGRLTATQLLKQTRAGLASRPIVERMGGEALSVKLRSRPELQTRLDALMGQIVGNDMIRIRYKLKSEVTEQISRIKARADAMEQALSVDEARQAERESLINAGQRSGTPTIGNELSRSILARRQEIAKLKDEIDRLLESDENFQPDRISLMRFRDESAYTATLPFLVYERGHYFEQQSTWNQIHLELD